MYRHILIPTDGSELAERAVTHGLSLAIGAKVTVIIVEEQPSTLFAIPDPGVGVAFVELTEQIKKHAASALERTANAAKQAGVPCETVQVQDVQPPYEAIIATATDRGCDLIVMASHGRSGLSALVLGSVTNQVLTHTKTPVLVCQ
jgi:nucleotide-binding universal stress UspA family protein